jgi:hypothetical protein
MGCQRGAGVHGVGDGRPDDLQLLQQQVLNGHGDLPAPQPVAQLDGVAELHPVDEHVEVQAAGGMPEGVATALHGHQQVAVDLPAAFLQQAPEPGAVLAPADHVDVLGRPPQPVQRLGGRRAVQADAGRADQAEHHAARSRLGDQLDRLPLDRLPAWPGWRRCHHSIGICRNARSTSMPWRRRYSRVPANQTTPNTTMPRTIQNSRDRWSRVNIGPAAIGSFHSR